MERESGVEHTEQTVELVYGNLPYAEESKHMVDAVNVEILGHLAETGLPPGEDVAVHLLPVVCRESPVLAKHREIIRRRAGLAVEVEQAGGNPRVDTVAGDADGDVALYGHPVGMGIVANRAHLLVEVILNPAYIVDVALVLLDEVRHGGLVILGVLAPFREVGRAVAVAQHTESRIGNQP